jgi:hypothetical protein
MRRTGEPGDLHLDQPLGRKADRIAQNVCVGVFSTSAIIISSVIGGSSLCLDIAARSYRRSVDDHLAKPLAAYGAMWGALCEWLCQTQLHHEWDTTLGPRLSRAASTESRVG